MIKLKGIVSTGAVLAAGVLSPSLIAQPTITGTISLDQGAYSYYVGGEFTAVSTIISPNPSLSLLTSYQSVAGTPTVQQGTGTGTGVAGSALKGFQTFCVQTGVDFTPASPGYNNTTPYNYSTSLQSYDYVNGAAENANNNSVNHLTVGAAWLYSQFAQGTLSGYDFNLSNDATDAADRKADAGLLQAAIWALEGNQTYGDYVVPDYNTDNDPYYNAALNEFGGTYAGATAYVTTANYALYDVEVLNLYTGSSSDETSAQNQLVWFGNGPVGNIPPAPDSGTTLALLSLSLAALVVFGRSRGFGARQWAVAKLPITR